MSNKQSVLPNHPDAIQSAATFGQGFSKEAHDATMGIFNKAETDANVVTEAITLSKSASVLALPEEAQAISVGQAQSLQAINELTKIANTGNANGRDLEVVRRDAIAGYAKVASTQPFLKSSYDISTNVDMGTQFIRQDGKEYADMMNPLDTYAGNNQRINTVGNLPKNLFPLLCPDFVLKTSDIANENMLGSLGNQTDARREVLNIQPTGMQLAGDFEVAAAEIVHGARFKVKSAGVHANKFSIPIKKIWTSYFRESAGDLKISNLITQRDLVREATWAMSYFMNRAYEEMFWSAIRDTTPYVAPVVLNSASTSPGGVVEDLDSILFDFINGSDLKGESWIIVTTPEIQRKLYFHMIKFGGYDYADRTLAETAVRSGMGGTHPAVQLAKSNPLGYEMYTINDTAILDKNELILMPKNFNYHLGTFKLGELEVDDISRGSMVEFGYSRRFAHAIYFPHRVLRLYISFK